MEQLIQALIKGGMEHIASIVGICILLALLAVINRIKRDLVDKLIQLGKYDASHEASVKESISCDREINIELSRLLFGAKASRAGLFLFHNGSVFSTNSPIWKISSTHEVCEAGVTQEFHKVQDIKASLLTPLMSPMFTGIDSDGVESIKSERCPITGFACKRAAHIYRVSPEQIHNTFTQTFLMKRGTRFAIMSPLLNYSNNIVGFVFLEYCHDGFMTSEELDENAHLACRTASKIHQLISDLEPEVVVKAHSPRKGVKWGFPKWK